MPVEVDLWRMGQLLARSEMAASRSRLVAGPNRLSPEHSSVARLYRYTTFCCLDPMSVRASR